MGTGTLVLSLGSMIPVPDDSLKEVGDVAEGRYDWKIERGRGGISL